MPNTLLSHSFKSFSHNQSTTISNTSLSDSLMHITNYPTLSDCYQWDGNISLSSIASSAVSVLSSIPVIIGHRPQQLVTNNVRQNARVTIRHDNKVLAAAFLPKVSCYNMRSLMPKVYSFASDMEDRDVSVALLTEIWEKVENKRHQNKWHQK